MEIVFFERFVLEYLRTQFKKIQKYWSMVSRKTYQAKQQTTNNKQQTTVCQKLTDSNSMMQAYFSPFVYEDYVELAVEALKDLKNKGIESTLEFLRDKMNSDGQASPFFFFFFCFVQQQQNKTKQKNKKKTCITNEIDNILFSKKSRRTIHPFFNKWWLDD